jgi:hypothetical protein
MLQRHPHLIAIVFGLVLLTSSFGLLAVALNAEMPGEDWIHGGIVVFPPDTPDYIAFAEMLDAGASPAKRVWAGFAWGFQAEDERTIEQLRAGRAWVVALSNPFGSMPVACSIAPTQTN